MSFQESISLMAIAVSFLSVFITLYFQYFRGPRVRTIPAEKVSLRYGNDYGLNLDVDVILLNEGAQPCVVKNIQCNLISQSKKLTLNWYGFFRAGNAAENEATQGFKNFIFYEGAAEMIPLKGYQIEKKKIGFIATEACQLVDEGDYILEMLVYTNIHPKQSYQYKLHFSLSADNLNELNSKCVANENGVVESIFFVNVEA